MFRRIYLDNSATTPVDLEVLEVMLPYLTDKFGNASSIHHFGQEAKAAVDKARHQAAGLVNSRPNEIVFTSGGTEANNLAVAGCRSKQKHGTKSSTVIEHPAVRMFAKILKNRFQSLLPVTTTALFASRIWIRIRERRSCFRVLNNETGPCSSTRDRRIVRGLREKGQKIWFHTDAVQAAGKIAVDVEEIGCDLLSLSAHKINAPKGVGALYVRRGVRLHSQNIGGRQERGVRGGTESVPMIAAFGKACEIAGARLESEIVRLTRLRDRFEDAVLENIPGSSVNGSVTPLPISVRLVRSTRRRPLLKSECRASRLSTDRPPRARLTRACHSCLPGR